MSAISSILMTTLATIGALALTKQMQKTLKARNDNLNGRRQQKTDANEAEVLELHKDPETGVYQRREN